MSKWALGGVANKSCAYEDKGKCILLFIYCCCYLSSLATFGGRTSLFYAGNGACDNSYYWADVNFTGTCVYTFGVYVTLICWTGASSYFYLLLIFLLSLK